MSFVQDYGLLRNLEEGTFVTTGNPLDLAISGRGFFVIESDLGPRYTRNGHFRLDEEGNLVTQGGLKVLDIDSDTINFGPDVQSITVAADGTIPGESPEDGIIARLQIVAFENEQRMRPVGGGLYEATDESEPADNARVVQGMIESSNVQAVVEITRMIDVLRSYQATQKMLETGHDLQRRAIDKLGRVRAS